MAAVPDDVKYTAEHEWVRLDESATTIRIGITDFAQQSLGDVVYVSLPALGATLSAGEAFGEVESTKSVSDLYAPASGVVVARNAELDDHPELINADPYGTGWIVDIQLSDPEQLTQLLDAAAYAALSA